MALVFPKISDSVPIGSLVLIYVYIYICCRIHKFFLKRRVEKNFQNEKCRKLAICIQYIEAMKGMDM